MSESDAERTAALAQFHQTYQQTKVGLLAAVVASRFPVETIDTLLDDLSATRRLVEQLVKADRLLRSPDQANAIEQESDAAAGGAPGGPVTATPFVSNAR